MALARERRIALVALTDHDTTDGLLEAEEAAREHGQGFVPGIEVSVTWGGRTVHILGLGIDGACGALQEGLQRLRAFRDWRAEEMGRRLEKAGIPGAYAGACALAGGRVVSRTHFARFLVAQRRAADVRDVFRRYLKNKLPGYVPGDWARVDEAVGWIREAGGVAVIAHPARYDFTATKLRALIGEFMECGGEAIEVVSSSHGPDETRAMAEHAKRFGLLASCGSDFHSSGQPWAELGRVAPLPSGCAPVWEHPRLGSFRRVA